MVPSLTARMFADSSKAAMLALFLMLARMKDLSMNSRPK